MRYLLISLVLLLFQSAFGQKSFLQGPPQPLILPHQIKLSPEVLEQLNGHSSAPAERQRAMHQLPLKPKAKPLALYPNLDKIVIDPHTQLPIYLEGNFDFLPQVQTRSDIPKASVFAFLNHFHTALQIQRPEQEFRIKQQKTGQNGITHTRLYQYFHDLPVYGAEIIIHSRQGLVSLFNGRYFASPQALNLQPVLSAKEAVAISRHDLSKSTSLLPFSPALKALTGEAAVSKQDLCIYFSDPAGREAHLAYEVHTAANPLEKWTYLIDAHRGTILKKFNRVCTLHGHPSSKHHQEINWASLSLPKSPISSSLLNGPRLANATDLSGEVRQINTYELLDTFYLLDASRPMWTNLPEFPNDFKGGIYTASANNTNTDNFESSNIISKDNNWNDPVSVSAHYNAGVSYEYFRQTFGRNSIDGLGGNIISFIDVADEDGGGLDNAFWNGQFMFYGSGRQAFAPLAGGLDVAGHEMSHGVIQSTANLEYQGESGAINESFADIFGVMIDRDDWLLAEDIVNRQVFPTGAMRNMMDPNNGGTRLGDRGWQPAHVNEQYFGSEDNGGVHINSGIHNRAYYLIANQVGKEQAEQIFYYALDNYLTRSSQFIDARLAAARAAEELYGPNVAAAVESAYDAVGINDGTPTAPPEEATPNEGQQYFLMVGEDNFGLYISELDGIPIQGANPLVSENILFKPSISDDGSRILYIDSNNRLKLVEIDWLNGNFNLFTLSENPIWRRAAISKDGLKAAVTTTDLDPTIIVFDLRDGSGQTFPLYNPTTAQGGINSGDVRYADGLEWDLSSEFVIYDAFNEVKSLAGSSTYFDIGSLHAWDNESDQFNDGYIEKLFATLPDGVSIGNPAISKNSPNILVFDYLDDEGNTAVLAVDIETGATGVIANTNNLGFPNYSVQDDYILYEEDGFFLGKVIKAIPLGTDKISANGQSFEINSGYRYPNWFATGSRVISSLKNRINPDQLSFTVLPNPGTSNLFVKTEIKEAGILEFELFDLLGKSWYQTQIQALPGQHQSILPIDQLPTGTYLLKMRQGQSITTQKIVKH